jgi:2-keto-4-pentenoate hydratase
MSDSSRMEQAARYLVEEHKAMKSFQLVPEEFAPRTMDEAYAVQEHYHSLRFQEYGAIAGYKAALTTVVTQQLLGLSEPIYGGLFEGTIHQSVATLKKSQYVQLGVECEIAVWLGDDLPASGAPYGRDSVAKAVSAAAAAFELVDIRNVDLRNAAPYALSVIAGNVMNAGVVLGRPNADWREVDLGEARGVLTINGAVAGEGYGRDVLGHPLEAVAWLANNLAKRSKSLTRGMVIMTGSIIAPKLPDPSDVVSFSVDGLGEVSARVS